ncbi:MAG: DNA cytosine methyltransferase [Candidatus Kapaibacterium sp.]|nr:MAG: DNA cytosine methyltransferase [Candidatus Kapabacteria bacterium]
MNFIILQKRKPKVIDLFAGCGGMSLGFENAGYEIVAAFDNWDAAINVYRQNFTHPIFKQDLAIIQDYTTFQHLRPDVIIGGPPCQDFSHAGKRDENGGRADLTISFAEIVCAVQPQFFVMENVERAITTQRYKAAMAMFHKAGYGLTLRVLDASYCGVPQKRKRSFLIGGLGERESFLQAYLDAGLSQQAMTVRQYFQEELGFLPNTEFYYRHPRNYSRRAVYTLDEPSATIRGVNRPIPPNYAQHSIDAASLSEGVRPLTTHERACIQTFPLNFQFSGTKSDMEQMIGNAVPVRLAEFVAHALQMYKNNVHLLTQQTELFA